MILIKLIGKRACGKTFIATDYMRNLTSTNGKSLLLCRNFQSAMILAKTYQLPDNIDIRSINMITDEVKETKYDVILIDEYDADMSRAKWSLINNCDFMITTIYKHSELRVTIERLDEYGYKEKK